jgi:uncharacterized damage-inducible protein DinB
MNLTQQMGKHLRDVHLGGNWTVSNLKDNLSDITWQHATTKIHSFNTIAALVYHMNYFVAVALRVLQGHPLEGKDSESFDHPPINSEEDWQKLLDKTFAEAELFASLIEQLPEENLPQDFADKKYGTYYRNIAGITEHTHYHMGQVVILKKLLKTEAG